MIDNRWMDKRLKEVLMIDELSIVETDKVNHTVETDMVKLVIEIECFGMSFDEFDKENGSSDGMQPKQEDLSCVHALNKPHLHEIHVVPNKYEADQWKCDCVERIPSVLDGAFGGVKDEEVIVGEGMVVTSSSLEMLTNSCLGGIMVSLIFLEGLEEEGLVEFMVEWFEEDEDGKKNGKEGLFNLKA
ncbi:hypothetical protein Tco_0018017 [Tanacetum coccineum]